MSKHEEVKAALIKYLSEQSQQLIVELQKDAKYLAQILTTPIPDPFKFGSDYKTKLVKLSRNIRCLEKIVSRRFEFVGLIDVAVNATEKLKF